MNWMYNAHRSASTYSTNMGEIPANLCLTVSSVELDINDYGSQYWWGRISYQTEYMQRINFNDDVWMLLAVMDGDRGDLSIFVHTTRTTGNILFEMV